MPTIQIKNVSPEAHAVLCQRAAEAHQSLQEYLRSHLEEEASQPTLHEVLARAGNLSGGSATFAETTAAVRSDRDNR
ncbi:MAG: FitA-like ribbon-helix-helix domain-containing protein [Corynebacterium variabile]|uniref:FitA-like ribbon-helix-helix domain-containing protein n=1 Tax=Corynebacterium variabile TaxID=1727 RepID=UPI003FB7E00F